MWIGNVSAIFDQLETVQYREKAKMKLYVVISNGIFSNDPE